MEGVETLEAFGQNRLVARSEPRPAFEDAVQTQALRTLEFLILQVRVVNHFGDALHCFVSNAKAFDHRFKRAILAVVSKLHFNHVVGDSLWIGRWFRREDESRLGVDKFADQPGRTDAIDLRARTRNPGFTAVVSRRNFWN